MPAADGLSAGGELGLGIRPQRVRWGRAAGPEDVELAARVQLVESVGASKMLLCELLQATGDAPAEVRAIVPDDEAPEEGAVDHVSFRLAHSMVIRGTDPSSPAEPWLGAGSGRA
jgi:hypothetical protein